MLEKISQNNFNLSIGFSNIHIIFVSTKRGYLLVVRKAGFRPVNGSSILPSPTGQLGFRVIARTCFCAGKNPETYNRRQ
jgi:hypothetical protein